jgi:cytochrome b
MTDTRTNAGVRDGGADAPPELWDPLVRLTHWGVASAVVANGLITEDGSAPHIWVGWAVFGLLALRFVWGFTGPREARFSTFPPRPIAALKHLSDLLRGTSKHYPSHNPAGSIMAYALWACLGLVVLTGLVMTDAQSPLSISEQKAAVAAGDWSVLVEGEESRDHEGVKEIAEETHELAANLVFVLAFLHIAGVALESRLLGRNLVMPMLTGRKKSKRDAGAT